MDPDVSYYSQQGKISEPGRYTHVFDGLPTGLEELVRVVQGVTIHPFWTENYGVQLPPERSQELQLRSLEPRLGRTLELDPRPITSARSADKRLLGNCRDHSLLLSGMLRHQGTAARARCGFGAYFAPNFYVDHWVVEYWNQAAQRWVLVDAQLDEVQRQALHISFDPLDVPRDQFIVGGMAWEMCRSGRADPNNFGIFDMKGLGFVCGNLLRDVASLNKVELLPWDCWGVMLKDPLDDPADLALLDGVAALTAGDVPDPQAVRSLYQSDPRLRMDGSLLSFVNGDMLTVELAL